MGRRVAVELPASPDFRPLNTRVSRGLPEPLPTGPTRLLRASRYSKAAASGRLVWSRTWRGRRERPRPGSPPITWRSCSATNRWRCSAA